VYFGEEENGGNERNEGNKLRVMGNSSELTASLSS